MSQDIIIQYIPQEIRVAVREESRLSDLLIERPNFRNPVGNVYKGRVVKVIPGMDSAFIDIGLTRAGFLNIEDLVVHDTESDILFKKPKKNGKHQIENLLTEGQEIVVQVSKAPISTKGARISTEISLPGRNVVFLPGGNSIALSRQISNEQEKNRLKKIMQSYKMSSFGLIVRTFGQNTSEKALRNEIDQLVKIWSDIEQKASRVKAPGLLFEEPNIIHRLVRDSLGHDIDNIVIDDKDEFLKLQEYLDRYMPEFSGKLTLYEDQQNILEAYGLGDDMQTLMARKIPLKSGGGLIIDQSEALTSIDVNTGRFLGEKSHERTILQTNLEAAEEIVHQIKLRNIGGIIIIDFIDMEKSAHRAQVYKKFKEEMRKDRARSQISAISDIGLIEMTRQRTQENINKLLSQPCHCCGGTGLVLSTESTFFSICRELYRLKRHRTLPDELLVYAHPDIVDYTEFSNREGFKLLIRKLGVKIRMMNCPEFHSTQYKISSA